MKVHGLDKLDAFCLKHPPARSWIRTWLADARNAQWTCPQDIKFRYARASFLGSNRVIFDVKGNDFRMVNDIAYKVGVIVVTWIGTHDAYDKLDWEVKQNEANGR